MTRGEIWKDFLKHTVLTLVIALFLFLIFKSVFTKNGETEYFYVWLCCGIPFGIRRMFVWLVPHGYDLGGTVGIIAVNFIIGGLIGGVILTWRLVVAVWYIPLTVLSPPGDKSSVVSDLHVRLSGKSLHLLSIVSTAPV